MNKMQPKVSFIIPYYNAGSTIQETIDSILNQTYKNYDIWIVNDGSTDTKSIEKLNQYSDTKYIHIINIPNSGPGIARNVAIQNSDAEFIFPIDSDDKMTESAIVDSLKEFELDRHLGVVFGNAKYFGKKDGIKKQRLPDDWSLLISNPIANAALIKKCIFDEVGLYDEFLSKPGLEDWELWIRVFYSKWKMKHIDKIFFEIRVQEHSRTFQVANTNLDIIYSHVYSKHAKTIFEKYLKLYYLNKQINEGIDMKLSRLLLKPYRLIKKIFQ